MGEPEGAKPTSNSICRPEKPAQQAFGERSEDFCASYAGIKVTAALGCQKSPVGFFDSLSGGPVGPLLKLLYFILGRYRLLAWGSSVSSGALRRFTPVGTSRPSW